MATCALHSLGTNERDWWQKRISPGEPCLTGSDHDDVDLERPPRASGAGFDLPAGSRMVLGHADFDVLEPSHPDGASKLRQGRSSTVAPLGGYGGTPGSCFVGGLLHTTFIARAIAPENSVA